MESDEIKSVLFEIAELLESGKEYFLAAVVRNALSDCKQPIGKFLASNELWGGAGSIADQAFSNDVEKRKVIESLLIHLGRLQMSMGCANVRTEMWTTAFEHWKNTNLNR